jgi:anti-anti-sigma regulatory factor
MDKLLELWQKVTTPRAEDADIARREHATRVVIATFSVTIFVTTLIFIIAWVVGAVSYAFPVSGLVASLFFAGSLMLIQSGHWRITSYVPPMITFLAAVYGTYLQGIETGSVLFFLLTVILAGITENKWAQWIAMLLSVIAYVGIGTAHTRGYLTVTDVDPNPLVRWAFNLILSMTMAILFQRFLHRQLKAALHKTRDYVTQLAATNAQLSQEVEERQRAESERAHLLEEQATLQQEVIEAQRETLKELSTPIIPLMEIPGKGAIITMPLIGSIDTLRAQDIMRSLLAGISEHRASVVILDITGVPVVDSGVAGHLNKTIQAARLKGTRVIVTGISDAVAEAIVELGINWQNIETLRDLQTGLHSALTRMGQYFGPEESEV